MGLRRGIETDTLNGYFYKYKAMRATACKRYASLVGASRPTSLDSAASCASDSAITARIITVTARVLTAVSSVSP